MLHAPQSLPIPAGLVPFLPAIYVAWADGELSEQEIAVVRLHAAECLDTLPSDVQEALDGWLNPAKPPAAADLIALLIRIRTDARALPDARRLGLAELGMSLARADAAASGSLGPRVRVALERIERALGLLGSESTRELFIPPQSPPRPSAKASVQPIDVDALTALLDGPYAEVRRDMRKLLSGPAYRHEFPLPTEEYRQRVLSWLGPVAGAGFGALAYPYGLDGEPKSQDLGGFLAAFETLAEFDLSLVVKFGVQFGLFGCSILFLGSDRHHRDLLAKVGRLELPGCFAMTERGHGSNVAALETTATYEKENDTFVIDSPSASAHKWYIGNAARHGRMATVFAQLLVDGEGHGVHAFLVPIRSPQGEPAVGVGIGDCGDKMGLDGVDNGWLSFHRVRVPREALLDRFAQVDADGHYHSPIASPTRRFFTMLSALVGGRIAVGSAGVTAAKVGLTIALRYGERRRQFGPAGQGEWRLLDYQRHRHRLLPRLATVYALHFATQHMVRRYLGKSEEDAREVEALAAALKAYQTWFATETIQDCREACGAEGYMARNRITALKADTDVFTTFEGDNTVLMQLVAKTLLSQFSRGLATGGFYGLVRYLTRVVVDDAAERNFVTARRTSDSHLRDPDYQRDVFRYRKEELTRSLGKRLKKRLDAGADAFEAFAECQQHALSLARAYAEHNILEAFCEGIEAAEVDAATRGALELCRDVFALWRMQRDAAWFLEHGLWEPAKARAVRRLLDPLLVELRPLAPALLDAFAIADHCLAPIALAAEGG